MEVSGVQSASTLSADPSQAARVGGRSGAALPSALDGSKPHFLPVAVGEGNAIILDCGDYSWKIGVARELAPRGVIPLAKLRERGAPSDMIFEYILRHAFFQKLHCNPSQKLVVLCEKMIVNREDRDILIRILFEKFKVPGILSLPSSTCALHLLGSKTALVVDMGYRSTFITPVFEGVPIVEGIVTADIGSITIYNRLQHELKRIYPNLDPTENDIEDIIVKSCFLHPLCKPEYKKPVESVVHLCHRVPSFSVEITGDIRGCVAEALFDEKSEEWSLTKLILASIRKCPIDLRATFAKSILVLGGSSEIPGLTSRLIQELKARVTNTYPDGVTRTISYFEKNSDLSGLHSQFACIPLNFSASLMSWAGCSIATSYDPSQLYPHRMLTLANYRNRGVLADPLEYMSSKN